jgi:rubrerythrin
MNVFDFAMKMELDGKAFYEGMSKRASIAGLKNIFSMLADDEQKHYETIQSLKEKTGHTAMADSGALENSKNIFSELMAEKERSDTMKEDLDAYRYAMKIEADSVRFYENAARRERKSAVKSLLLKIAEEEKNHFNIVENIYDFVLSPKYFLAWGEFTNLKEF